jgi:hypothetical protein
MKVATIQLWEVSNSDNSIISDGCSLHIDKIHRDKYVKEKKIKKVSSDPYERISGIESFIEVPDNIWILHQHSLTFLSPFLLLS